MKNTRKFDLALVIISTIFILSNAFFSVKNLFVLNALPFLLIVISLFLFSPNKVFLLITFLAPLSIPLRRLIPGLDFDFWVPTEPLVLGLSLILIIKSFKESYFDKDLVNHSVFWVLIFYLGWIFICIFPSELPFVSLKYLLVRIWFIGVFFYFGYHLFKTKPHFYLYFLWVFVAGMLVVSAITIVQHASIGLFNQKAAHGACTPFFIDHTSYGAAIAFTLAMLLGLFSMVKKKAWQVFIVLLIIYFSFALIFSYSRAAWISVLFAIGVGLVWLLKIRFRTFLFFIVIIISTAWIFNENINRWLNDNKTESSGNLKEHLNSIINIKTDASNLERLNRWNAALRMFEERPIFGWGPGTYMFFYAPYQRSYQKTIISTNFGTHGNAHSEYLGLLSETGLPAVIAYILLLLIVICKGLKISRNTIVKEYKVLLLSAVLGLVTYTIHGVMNNFLDCDKIAIPFWAFIAFIVAMDVYVASKEKVEKSAELEA